MQEIISWTRALLVVIWLTGGCGIDAAFADDRITVDDRLLIQDLITLYGRTYDDRDAEGWSALFSENASMPIYIAEKLTREMHTNEDRRKFAQSRFESFEKDGVFKTRHFQTNTLLNPLEDGTVEGTTLFYVTFQYAAETTPRPIHTGLYRDRFVKTPAGWQFSMREIHIDHK